MCVARLQRQHTWCTPLLQPVHVRILKSMDLCVLWVGSMLPHLCVPPLPRALVCDMPREDRGRRSDADENPKDISGTAAKALRAQVWIRRRRGMGLGVVKGAGVKGNK